MAAHDHLSELTPMRIALALALIALVWALLLADVEPIPTWFYVAVWYPSLVLLDELAARIGRQPPVLRGGRRLISLFGWSAVIWLLFEVANFRLQNWYYVFLPHHPVERWAGVLVSFATVVPALVLIQRLLDAWGIGRRWHSRPVRVRAADLHASVLLGVATAVLALGWPRVFFPLTWGAAWLIADPLVYRRRREWSLLADIERGEWGRVGRVMLGGLLVGMLWEFYNHWARGKWIYTVPWLEQLKLFEMPPFGFVGFPVFALEAWALYHVLCAYGVARPVEDGPAGRRAGGQMRTAGATVAAVTFAVLALTGMERRTISSVVPRLDDLPTMDAGTAEVLRRQGVRSPFALARATPDSVRAVSPPAARQLVETAQLVTLRGIGTEHAAALRAVGAATVCRLAAEEDAVLLWGRIRSWMTRHGRWDPRPTLAEVRVWIRAAERECHGRS